MDAHVVPDPPQPFRRRSVRLVDHGYGHGLYFVTICGTQRTPLFGAVNSRGMCLSPVGEIARDEWARTLNRPEIVPDVFVVMPDHVHVLFGVVPIGGDSPTDTSCGRGTARCAPTPPPDAPRAFGQVVPRTVPAIIRAYKSAVTRAVRQAHPEMTVWQRGYHDRVVRSEREAQNTRRYIAENPERWASRAA
ncbi:MAG: transposase [Bacteroidota bacterium]